MAAPDKTKIDFVICGYKTLTSEHMARDNGNRCCSGSRFSDKISSVHFVRLI